MVDGRLQRQLEFLMEIDRLKGVLRRSYVLLGSRHENAAEHSWHAAVAALLLAEHAAVPVDPSKVATMMLVHDIVEVDAGDAFVYDRAGDTERTEREARAAARLFGLLPPDQGAGLKALWEEFEARQTPEARFAAGLDRLLPILHNYHSRGSSWREHGISADQVVEVNRHMAEGSPALWAHVRELVDDAVAKGFLAPPREAAEARPQGS